MTATSRNFRGSGFATLSSNTSRATTQPDAALSTRSASRIVASDGKAAGQPIHAKHYTRWIPKEYVEPMRLLPGEIPADLLACLSSNYVKSFRARCGADSPSYGEHTGKVVTRARFERATPI